PGSRKFDGVRQCPSQVSFFLPILYRDASRIHRVFVHPQRRTKSVVKREAIESVVKQSCAECEPVISQVSGGRYRITRARKRISRTTAQNKIYAWTTSGRLNGSVGIKHTPPARLRKLSNLFNDAGVPLSIHAFEFVSVYKRRETIRYISRIAHHELQISI